MKRNLINQLSQEEKSATDFAPIDGCNIVNLIIVKVQLTRDSHTTDELDKIDFISQ